MSTIPICACMHSKDVERRLFIRTDAMVDVQSNDEALPPVGTGNCPDRRIRLDRPRKRSLPPRSSRFTRSEKRRTSKKARDRGEKVSSPRGPSSFEIGRSGEGGPAARRMGIGARRGGIETENVVWLRRAFSLSPLALVQNQSRAKERRPVIFSSVLGPSPQSADFAGSSPQG
ncbi:hypothetical protein KM043_010552 [Ampulex compressa]|nr:hypothetical protein KM043_010552 [Ampulex compressa]